MARKHTNEDIARILYERSESIPITGCRIWTGPVNHSGYGTMRSTLTHRLAWAVHKGPIPDGLHVCHHCDCRPCVNVNHLFLGTNADNVADKMNKGRHQRLKGVDHGMAKLTEHQVLAIRQDNRSLTTIARDYGVTFGLIGHIKHRRLWKHI